MVIGGLENIAGTFAAGIAFGLMQAIGGASYGMLISYIFLIIIMTLDPHGVFIRFMDSLKLKKTGTGISHKEPEK